MRPGVTLGLALALLPGAALDTRASKGPAGGPFVPQAQLLAPDGAPFDLFGLSVAGFGDTLVVGASADDTPGGLAAGSAYVFVRFGATWTLQQKLVASDGEMGDLFGGSVAISGDTVVIGAEGVNTPGEAAGAAYVFVRSGTTWTEQQKLLASDGAEFDNFGVSVSISGDTVLVGARLDDSPFHDAGSAYVFVRSGATWTEQQKLVAADPHGDVSFGWSVSLSGDTALIGAVNDDDAGIVSGSAYVFARSGTTWSQQQKLIGSDVGPGDYFGDSVSIAGDTAVVGAPSPLSVGETGCAYVFVRSGTTWTEQQKLVASDAAADDRFGEAVSVHGDTVVVGATGDNTPGGESTGSVYVFTRSGTAWTEQQKLLAPDAAPFDDFGASASAWGYTVAAGAPFDATAGGDGAGSAHVFVDSTAPADAGVTKTDGQTMAPPGTPVTYTIVVSNFGPTAAIGATVTDALPAALIGASWTCSPSAGSTCTPSGSGSIDDVVSLLVGGTATYVLDATVDPAATGALANTVTVSSALDPNPANDSATDVDIVTIEADLALTKTDGPDPVFPGDPLAYVLTVVNNGTSGATSVAVSDTLPAGVTFVSSVPGPPVCGLAGGSLTCALGALAVGASAVVTIDVTVDDDAGSVLVNTASVSAAETDPVPGNNTATATTTVRRAEGELVHGSVIFDDLAALAGPIADDDVFRISQKPYSSYEVVVDATSGDIGVGAGPLLQRVASDATSVLQGSLPIGTGSSRSLRWLNPTAALIEDQMIRVRSAGCGTDCGPDDVYRLRAYETTCSIPRFNNGGTQVTVLLLQNPTNYDLLGEIYFRDQAGALLAAHSFTLTARQTMVLDTATLSGLSGVGGAITIAHSGRYGDLSGKAVALEPATGFSFDSPLDHRPR